jgi:hypothetical protein
VTPESNNKGQLRLTRSAHQSLIDKALWENRHADPATIEAELRGPKGRGWLMRWLPARAHDNGLFLVYSNGIGVDDNEIRTGALSLRKRDDPRSVWTHPG